MHSPVNCYELERTPSRGITVFIYRTLKRIGSMYIRVGWMDDFTKHGASIRKALQYIKDISITGFEDTKTLMRLTAGAAAAEGAADRAATGADHAGEDESYADAVTAAYVAESVYYGLSAIKALSSKDPKEAALKKMNEMLRCAISTTSNLAVLRTYDTDRVAEFNQHHKEAILHDFEVIKRSTEEDFSKDEFVNGLLTQLPIWMNGEPSNYSAPIIESKQQ